jgi:hypothetical protein
MAMDYVAFEIGFWHPFGPHVLEAPEQIIERKRNEIATNGWTLWSFQYRRPLVLHGWSREVSKTRPRAVFVFCSASVGAVDPANSGIPVGTTDCLSYQFSGREGWQPLPAAVRVPHPFRGARRQASAFIVQQVVYPLEPFVPPAVEWLTDGTWRQDRIPTRGEYLIRPGGSTPMRGIRAILELKEPYLALVRADAA